MILLIDAYNVLKQISMTDQVSSQEKDAFIGSVKRYAKIKNIPIELVFDGGAYGLSDREVFGNVTVSHSGALKTADDVLIELIHAYKGRDLLLVSTDRALGRAAHQAGVDTLDSADFYKKMEQALSLEPLEQKKAHFIVKTSDEENPSLDELMHEFSKQVKKGIVEDSIKKRASSSQKMSKRAKKIQKKVSKL